MEKKNKFDFYMYDAETKNEYRTQISIDKYDYELEYELEYLLNVFKTFLKTIGFSEINISQIQYLEEDEWKYVSEQYNEWNEAKQKLYEYRKGLEDA